MMNFLKRSLQFELDSIFQIWNQSATLLRAVTKGAFTRARSKVSHRAFIELNQSLVTYMETHAALRTWHGFRLLTMDGSTLRVPNHPDTVEHFHTQPDSAKRNRPMARTSQLYDLLNQFTLDATIHPYRVGERELALEQGPALRSDALLLLDWGYPAFWFFAWLLSQSVPFCARVPLSSWDEVLRFAASGEPKRIITILPTKKVLAQCRRYQLPTTPLRLRLIRVVLPNAEEHVLITSLLDTHAFPHDCFQNLYHRCWGVEESYMQMKCRIEM